jgi:hypothetical protein
LFAAKPTNESDSIAMANFSILKAISGYNFSTAVKNLSTLFHPKVKNSFFRRNVMLRFPSDDAECGNFH